MHIVTGAAGFIGSNLVAHLNKQGHEDILLVDNLSMDKTKNLAYLRFEDMISPSELLEANIDKSDVVWHIGANSSTKETDWNKIYSSNVAYTRQLVSKCNTMVFASSASVYGDNITTQEHPVNEAPKNLYASSKLICDNIFRNTVGCKIQSWRFFNVYGNRESHKQAVGMGSPYTNFIKQAKDTGVIKIFEGSEKVQRDFVCIDDVVHVMYQCLQHDESFICNLGTSTTYTFEYWAKLIASHYNATIEYIPIPDDLKGIYQMYTCSDNNQLDTLINHNFKSPDQFVEENL